MKIYNKIIRQLKIRFALFFSDLVDPQTHMNFSRGTRNWLQLAKYKILSCQVKGISRINLKVSQNVRPRLVTQLATYSFSQSVSHSVKFQLNFSQGTRN